MTAYIQVELDCDGAPDDCQFCCPTPVIIDRTIRRAREAAKLAGWRTARRDGRLVDLCPDHQPSPTDAPKHATQAEQTTAGGPDARWW